MPRSLLACAQLVTSLVLLVALAACQKIEMSYCQMRLPPSRLMVDVDPLNYTLNQHADARTIGDAHGRDGESITYGLTTAKSSVRAEVKLHVLKIPGGVCARPDVVVHLAYQPVEVDVARELQSGSCGYTVVLGHEMKHVDVYRLQLSQSGARLRHEIDAQHLFVPVRYSDVEHAEAAMQALQDGWLVPKAQGFLEEAAAKQSAVDTPEEYQRVGSACPGNSLLSGETAPEQHRF